MTTAPPAHPPGPANAHAKDPAAMNDGPPPHLTQPLSAIDADLDAWAGSLRLPPRLIEAIRYALLGGGKRLRPLLAWHCCQAVTESAIGPSSAHVAPGSRRARGESSLPAGAAVELVHAFSLVHDDLPALDNDDFRRGRPTLHKVFGETMAILAGDAMLNLAFELLTDRVPDAHLAGLLTAELARGTSGMIAGQVYDTLGGLPADQGPEQHLHLIHRNKTGALIRAACRMGALCGLAEVAPRHLARPAAAPALTALSTYADSIGLMFQIVDDVIDVTQSAEHAGKKTGKDVEAGKLTYPAVLGLDRSRREIDRCLEGALEAIGPLGAPATPLAELATYLARRTK